MSFDTIQILKNFYKIFKLTAELFLRFRFETIFCVFTIFYGVKSPFSENFVIKMELFVLYQKVKFFFVGFLGGGDGLWVDFFV